MNINPFIDLIAGILNLYAWILIIAVIINLLTAFNIINAYQPFVQKLSYALYRLTEPVLRPIRNMLPDLGGIDISPIIVFFLIQFFNNVLYTYLYTNPTAFSF